MQRDWCQFEADFPEFRAMRGFLQVGETFIDDLMGNLMAEDFEYGIPWM